MKCLKYTIFSILLLTGFLGCRSAFAYTGVPLSLKTFGPNTTNMGSYLAYKYFIDRNGLGSTSVGGTFGCPIAYADTGALCVSNNTTFIGGANSATSSTVGDIVGYFPSNFRPTPNGQYAIYSYGTSTSNVLGYTLINYTGSTTTDITPPADTSTRLISIVPANGSTISTSTATTNLSGTFYNQTTTYNRLMFSLSNVEPAVGSDLSISSSTFQQFTFNISTSSSVQNFSTTTLPLSAGRYLVTAYFSNGTSGSSYFTATSTTFTVGSSTVLYSDFVYSTTTQYGQISDSCQTIYASSTATLIEKSLCWVSDRFTQGISYLFVPSGVYVDKYMEFKDSLLARAPFGYMDLIKTQLNTLTASTSPAFNLSIPLGIKNGILAQIRSLLGTVLVCAWLIFTFIRLKNIQI